MFILFIVIIVIGVMVISRTAKTETNQCEKMHKWVIRFNNLDNQDKKGYLVCKVCGKIPGEE